MQVSSRSAPIRVTLTALCMAAWVTWPATAAVGVTIINPGNGSDDDPPPVSEAISLQSTNESARLRDGAETLLFGGVAAEQPQRWESGAPVPTAADLEQPGAATFWRKGFREVVPITFNDRFVCSGTVVNASYVVTAAHCVTTQQFVPEEKHPVAVTLPTQLFGVVVPYKEGSACYFLQESDIDKVPERRCNVRSVGVQSIEVQQEYLQNPTLVGRDIAVLYLAEEIPDSMPQARIGRGVLVETEVLTVAGYGYSNVGGTSAGGILQVGWRATHKINAVSNLIQWPIDLDHTASSSCKYDSGGPVFLGFQQGRRGEQHVLVGVIVGLVRAEVEKRVLSDGVEYLCKGGVAINALLDSEGSRDWLCRVTGTTLVDCE